MHETIAAVHAEDVHKVRQLLRGAIDQANDEWLPSSAIFDALTLEMIELASRYESPSQVATHLMELAALLKRTQAHTH